MILSERDYEFSIPHHELVTLLDSNPFAIEDAEALVAGVISSYLKSQYDMSKVFVKIVDFQPDAVYKEGARVYKMVDGKKVLHHTVLDETGKALNLVEGDNMDPVIRNVMMDMVLYYVHKKISLDVMPQKVCINYEKAIDWLKGVNAKKYTPDLPTYPVEPGELPAESAVLWWSRPRKNTHNII